VPFTAGQLAAGQPRALPGTAREKLPAPKGAAPTGLAVAGNGTVWQYLYKNKTCELSAGITINAVFTRNGRPAANLNTTGYTHTGSCEQGAGSRFYFNLTAPLSAPSNPLWWGGGVTNETGAALGNGANDGPINLAINNAPRSLVIYEATSGAPFACCDLAPGGPIKTNWAEKLLALPGALPCEEEAAGEGASSGGHGGSSHGKRRRARSLLGFL
jgi:hypothetical protein